MFGNSFFFSKGDDIWKKKRRASAHAFYKDRLVHMLDALKDKVFDAQNEWLNQIKDSDTNSTTIDLSKDILKIFQKFLAHIIYGDEEINSLKIMMIHRTQKGDEFE